MNARHKKQPKECHPLLIHINGEYQAWCRPCQWESPTFNAESWARAAMLKHSPQEEGDR